MRVIGENFINPGYLHCLELVGYKDNYSNSPINEGYLNYLQWVNYEETDSNEEINEGYLNCLEVVRYEVSTSNEKINAHIIKKEAASNQKEVSLFNKKKVKSILKIPSIGKIIEMGKYIGLIAMFFN
jgi:hypothetical protein